MGFLKGLVFDQGVPLEVTRASVKIQMDVLDFTIFAKFIANILICGLFVDIADEDDPSFNG